MSDDPFLDRLRADAGALRHDAGDVSMQRLRARIRERILEPTVMELLARWVRPIAVIALAGAITVGIVINQPVDDPLEVTIAGDTFRVGD